MASDDNPPSTLRGYLDIVWRRSWIVLQAMILLPAVAVLWSSLVLTTCRKPLRTGRPGDGLAWAAP